MKSKSKICKYCVFCIILLLGISGCHFIPLFRGKIIKESDKKLVLQIPGKKWKFQFDYDSVSYISHFDRYHEHGEFAHVIAVIEPNWTFTITFGRQDRRKNIDDEIEIFKLMNGRTLEKESIESLPGFPNKVYTSQIFRDTVYPLDINQLSKHIVFFYDGVGGEIKISKFRYTPEDEETYKKLINSIKIIED